jgi:hypothetical protein
MTASRKRVPPIPTASRFGASPTQHRAASPSVVGVDEVHHRGTRSMGAGGGRTRPSVKNQNRDAVAGRGRVPRQGKTTRSPRVVMKR